MAEDIYNRYTYQMHNPPAGFEEAYFVIKAVLIHLISRPFIIPDNVI